MNIYKFCIALRHREKRKIQTQTQAKTQTQTKTQTKTQTPTHDTLIPPVPVGPKIRTREAIEN